MKKPVTFTLEESTIERLREVSSETMIPQARLVEAAILEYLEKMTPIQKHPVT